MKSVTSWALIGAVWTRNTDVTGNDPIITGKIALAHLNEYADYYTRLKKMEKEAEEQHGKS